MARPSFVARWISWWLIAGIVVAAEASAVDLEISAFALPDEDAQVAAVLDGTHDGQFSAVPGNQVHLFGGEGRTHWVRLAFDLPQGGAERGLGQILRFDRVPLDRITVYMPQEGGGRSPLSDGFFKPASDGSLAPDSYAFAVPHDLSGPQVVYVAVQGLSRISLTPRLLGERAFHAEDRAVSSVLSATYASILVLTLSALALYLALHDRAYLHFIGLTSFVLLLLAAFNGHLYRWPLFEWLASWRNNGLYALGLVCSSLALGFTQHFLDAPQASESLSRFITRARLVLFAAAGFALLNLSSLTLQLQTVAGLLFVLAVLCILGLTLHAWRRGEHLARAYSLVWLILAVAVTSRVALGRGWLPQNVVTLYGFQVATAFCLFLMSIGLADRVLEFRKQRDQAKRLKEQTDVSLQVEQVRRQFADGLREQLRNCGPGGDREWLAFNHLLDSLHELLPQLSSAVVAVGYHGRDLVITEPMHAKERYSELMRLRSGTLKSLCRSRTALQLRLDEAGDDADPPPSSGLLAVVPIPMPAPGWGALLIERAPSHPFEAGELKLAAEFLALAVAATDEAAGQAELRRKAEIDPLTGVCNRRAGDLLLNKALRNSVAEREPFSLLFADIDHFKQVNDNHGHAVGDVCLRRVADTIRQQLGNQDVLVRYGGEEFLVILPGQATEEARQLGERIRQAVILIQLDNNGGPVRFTVSIGVAGRLPGEEDALAIVERADRALYSAKRNGRNQVHVAQSFGYGKTGEDSEPPPPLSL